MRLLLTIFLAGMLATAAGKLLRQSFGTMLAVSQALHYDIKLAIDEQSQQAITRIILAEHPDHCILGEEGSSGNPLADVRWVVDPLDGTVNYYYNIPHYAVSIAVQEHVADDQWQTVAGVVLDPELNELFTGQRGQPIRIWQKDWGQKDEDEARAVLGRVRDRSA